jgi:hypothetical protein
MNVKGRALIEIELSIDDQIEVTINTLKRVLDWADDVYVDSDGNLIREQVCYSSHAFTDYITVRTATEDDKALQRLINKLLNSHDIFK